MRSGTRRSIRGTGRAPGRGAWRWWPAGGDTRTGQRARGDVRVATPGPVAGAPALARDGVKRIAIVTPGFAADCVETLEEISGEAKEIFLEHGGEQFSLIPCLNDSEGGIRVLVHLIEQELKGWID